MDTVPETLAITDEGAIRTVRMNRPDQLNALNALMMDELTDALLAAGRDDAVKVVILTGEGRAFSAGADLAEMLSPPSERRHGLVGMIEALIDFPKPLIAAVNGIGVGYGATVCGLADRVVMSEDARLRAPFSALGITAELASTYTFARLMGRQDALWFLAGSEWLDAAGCLEAGLAAEVAPADELLSRANERAATLAALPLSSLVTTKALIVGPHRQAMKDAMRAENAALAELTGGPANKEAVAAFMEKRQPDFTGL